MSSNIFRNEQWIVTNLRKYSDATALEKALKCVGKIFSDSDVTGKLFNDCIKWFLFFDQSYITEPHEFFKISNNSECELTIGYLHSLKDRKLGLKDDEAYPIFNFSASAEETEIRRVFSLDPQNESEAAIQIFIKSGFVVNGSCSWGIWFSKYWEIAIAGFINKNDMNAFTKKHNHISYYDKSIISRKFSGYSESVPLSELTRYINSL